MEDLSDEKAYFRDEAPEIVCVTKEARQLSSRAERKFEERANGKRTVPTF